MSFVNKCTEFFERSQIYNPRPRYTLEEIAQRIAIRKGLSYKSVLKDLRVVFYGEEVS